MAFVSVSGSTGQIFNFDSNNPDNLNINVNPDNIRMTISSLQTALKMSQEIATAFGITETAPSSTSTSSTPATN